MIKFPKRQDMSISAKNAVMFGPTYWTFLAASGPLFSLMPKGPERRSNLALLFFLSVMDVTTKPLMEEKGERNWVLPYTSI